MPPKVKNPKATTVTLRGERLKTVDEIAVERGYIQRTPVINDLIDEERKRRGEKRLE